MSAELITLIEQGNKAFSDFKALNDKRFEKTEAQVTEELKKAFDDMTSVKSRLDDLDAKMKRPGNGAAGQKTELELAQDEHKQAFGQYIRKGTEFDIGLETKALASTTNSGADGGYAVPKVIDSMIESLVVNISPIRQISDVVQVSTQDYHKIVNLRGTASGWVAETAARSATTTPTIADVAPPMGELYANPQATQRMLDDVFFNAEQWLADQVATEFARAEGAAFIAGSGTDQPKGILSYTLASTDDASRAFGQLQYVPTGVAGDWAASNKADILFTLVSKLKAAYRANAAFVMAKAILFELSAFKDSNGRYLFDFSTVPGKQNTLLGYPIIEAEDVPAKAASSYSVLFGDFKRGYLVVDRVGIRVVRDPFSNKPYIGFYTVKRVGGGVVNSEAIKALKFAVS